MRDPAAIGGRRAVADALVLAGLGLVYGGLGVATIAWSRGGDAQAAVWLGNAVAIAVLYRFDRIPLGVAVAVVAAACAAANLASGTPAPLTAVFTALNATMVAAAAAWLRRFRPPANAADAIEVAMPALAVPVLLLPAIIGGAAGLALSAMVSADLVRTAAGWAMGEVFVGLAILPLALFRHMPAFGRDRLGRAGLLLVAVVFAALLMLANQYLAYPFALYSPLLLAVAVALRTRRLTRFIALGALCELLAPVPPPGQWLAGMFGTPPAAEAQFSFALVVVPALVCALLVERLAEQRDQLAAQRDRLALRGEELESARRASERANEQLRQRNEALDAFAGLAAHDLKEPVRKAATFIEMILSDAQAPLPPAIVASMRRAAAELQRAITLVGDLRQLARLQARELDVSMVPVDDLLAAVLAERHASLAAVAASVQLEVPPSVVVEGDRAMLVNAIERLLDNALKFREPLRPLVVRIAARATDIDAPSAGDAHAAIALTVEDNGIGFEPQFADDIVRPARRLHSRERYAGNGIGLAIVAAVAQRHGGRLVADGRPGEGARITIELPRHQPCAAAR